MDLETIKHELMKHLGTVDWLTLKNLSKRVGESRKKTAFVLHLYNDAFEQRYRNPANVVGRKRPVWSIKKLTEVSA